MKNYTRIQIAINEIHKLITKGKPQEAYILLNNFDKNLNNDLSFLFIKVALLIDIGNGLQNIEIVKEGIGIGEFIMSKLDRLQLSPAHIATNTYNLSNGYDALYKMMEYGCFENIPLSENLQKAKYYLRLTIELIQHLDEKLAVQIYVNYGNCLDQLGRGVEAIYAYDNAISIAPKFSMAIANKAKAELYFSQISGEYRIPIMINSYQKIKEVINKKDLREIGTMGAKEHFTKVLKQIEDYINDSDLLNSDVRHEKYDSSELSEFEEEYIIFCTTEKLFLNFHIHENNCDAGTKDSVFISMFLKIQDIETFDKFAVQINQIKEDYAVARFHLFQSIYKNDTLKQVSKRTSFANTIHNSRFNLYNGLLKSAFKEAYNILDKIAVLINDYLNLGHDNNRIYFTSIWKEKNKFNAKIMDSKNLSLYALLDVYKDFVSNEYGLAKKIRNSITHRSLIVTNEDKTIEDIIEKGQISYAQLNREALKLLKLSKSCIIYTINFINEEETKKSRMGAKVANIDISTEQYL